MAQSKRKILLTALTLLTLYVGSYLYLSRRGYAEAEMHGSPGFYYLTPEDCGRWRFVNCGCVCLYWPLNAIDQWSGKGKGPASEPMWGLSKPKS